MKPQIFLGNTCTARAEAEQAVEVWGGARERCREKRRVADLCRADRVVCTAWFAESGRRMADGRMRRGVRIR
jgi:hypothetical protein